MSAIFVVVLGKFGLRFVKRNDVAAVFETVKPAEATQFANEADAWLTVRDYGVSLPVKVKLLASVE